MSTSGTSSTKLSTPSKTSIDSRQSSRYWISSSTRSSLQALSKQSSTESPLATGALDLKEPSRVFSRALEGRAYSRTSQAGCKPPLSDESVRKEVVKQPQQDRCFCKRCATVPGLHLLPLEHKLEFLTSELCKQKSQNLLLRRDILVLRKIVKLEVGGNAIPVDSLLPLASDRGWKGRQEFTLFLKRQLRDLSERRRTADNPLPTSRTSDERGDQCRFELQRREVLENAERLRRRWTTDRDLLSVKVKKVSEKNQSLKNELCALRGPMRDTARGVWNEEACRTLQDLENQFKTHQSKRSDHNRQLGEVQAAICRNTKDRVEIQSKILLEEQVTRDKDAIVATLRETGASLGHLAREATKARTRSVKDMKARLDEIEQLYDQVVSRAESNRDETKAQFRLRAGMSVKDESNCRQPNGGAISQYHSMLEALGQRNEQHALRVGQLSAELRDGVASFLRERSLLWRKTCETDLLKNQGKVTLEQRANPGQDGTVPELGERKQYLCILKRENLFIRTMIERVFESKQDDFEVFRNVLSFVRVFQN